MQLPRNPLAVLAAKNNGDRLCEPQPLRTPWGLGLDGLNHSHLLCSGFPSNWEITEGLVLFPVTAQHQADSQGISRQQLSACADPSLWCTKMGHAPDSTFVVQVSLDTTVKLNLFRIRNAAYPSHGRQHSDPVSKADRIGRQQQTVSNSRRRTPLRLDPTYLANSNPAREISSDSRAAIHR